MKQFNFLMLAGALCLTACADHPDLLGGGVGLSDNQISFSATTSNGSVARGMTRSNDATVRSVLEANVAKPLTISNDMGMHLYLHPVEQVGAYFYNAHDEHVTRTGDPLPVDGNIFSKENSTDTRGSKYTNNTLTTAFGVSAVKTSGSTSSAFFKNEKATPDAANTVWTTSHDYFWPTDGNLSFYAYFPYSDASHQMLSVPTSSDDVSKARMIHYAPSMTDISNQPDLIVASHPNMVHGASDAPTPVSLEFSHVLTAISFVVGGDMVPGTVKSITMSGVKNEGDYDLSTQTWENQTGSGTFTLDFGTQGKAVNGKMDTPITDATQTFMMVPQTFDASSTAQIQIVFTDSKGTAHTLTSPLKGNDWAAGSTIIYKVSTSALMPVLTTINAKFPTDWSSQKDYANKLKTAYVNGDKMGLYVVSQEGKVKAANVQVTFNGSTWTLADPKIRFNANDHFFAYTPYKASTEKELKGMPAANANVDVATLTDVHQFFKTLEDAWTPQAEQDTRANIDASDLQVSTATSINSTASGVDFTMGHAMGLADITLQGDGVKFQLHNDHKYQWLASLPSNHFEGKKLYRLACNHYIGVVKANTTTVINANSKYDASLWKNKLSFNPRSAQIEKHTAEKIDDQIHDYDIELGDIYYTKGEISHNSECWDRPFNTPIGIVGYIASGKGDDDYWVEKNTKQQGIGGHALVMCLKMVGSHGTTDLGSKYVWRSSGTTSHIIRPNDATSIINSHNQEVGSGYLSTKDMIAHGSPAGSAALAYNDLPAPADKSTGWFLPSIGQYYALLTHLGENTPFASWDAYSAISDGMKRVDNVEKAMEVVGDNNYTQFFQVGQDTYSSTDMDGSNVWVIERYGNELHFWDTYGSKGEAYGADWLRTFLAF